MIYAADQFKGILQDTDDKYLNLRKYRAPSDRKMSARDLKPQIPGWTQPFYIGQATSGRRVVISDQSSSQSLQQVVRLRDVDWLQPHRLTIASVQALTVESASDKSCHRQWVKLIK